MSCVSAASTDFAATSVSSMHKADFTVARMIRSVVSIAIVALDEAPALDHLLRRLQKDSLSEERPVVAPQGIGQRDRR